MKKALLNYWVDMLTGAALLVCAATGIVRLFPEATSVASGSATILGVSSALWATIHDWSGVAMAAGVAVHTALHLRWLAHMTHRVVRAGGPRRTAQPVPRAASPQAAAAVSLSRLEDRGRGAHDEEPSRMSRRAFLTGAAALGGVAVLGGATLLARSQPQATGTAAASSSSGETSYAASTTTTTTSSTSGTGTTEAETASASSSSTSSSSRVVVESGACVGCGDCLRVCPQGVFTMSGGTAVVGNADACTLCGHCLQACRPQAITLNG